MAIPVVALTILLASSPAGSEIDLVFMDGFEAEEIIIDPPPDGLCAEQLQGFNLADGVNFRRSITSPIQIGFTYEDLYEPWGSQSRAIISLPRGDAFSLPFSIDPALPDDATAIIRWSDVHQAAGAVRVSVSECRGGPLEENAVSANCIVQGGGVSGGFAMVLDGPLGCRLEKGRSYFFNAAFVTEEGARACGSATCNWATEEQ